MTNKTKKLSADVFYTTILGILVFLIPLAPVGFVGEYNNIPEVLSVKTNLGLMNTSELKVLTDLNAYRLKNNLSRVAFDKNTCNYARKRIVETKIDWSHSGFSNKRAGRPGGLWVENLARYANESQVLQAWINSPTHNKNLLAEIKYVCIKSDSGFWVFEGWKPL